MNRPFLSVVIPSYNERENLERGVLAQVRDFLVKQSYLWEVIVSDDDSPDPGSKKLAREFCQKNKGFFFLGNEHGGKPFALWSGIQKAAGEIILITDMDQSTPIAEVDRLLPLFDQCFDLVIGSRGGTRKSTSFVRQLASTLFQLARRMVLLPKIVDTQAGFKSFKRKVALDVFPKMRVIKLGRPKEKGWKVGAWDVEMLFVAEKCGYKIAEVPVAWVNEDVSTKKESGGIKFVRESLEMLVEIFRVRLNDWLGYYR